jgi:hypothetical protein
MALVCFRGRVGNMVCEEEEMTLYFVTMELQPDAYPSLPVEGLARIVRGAILPSVETLIPLKATRTLVTGGYLVGERQMVFGEVCTDRLLSTRYATRTLCLSEWSHSWTLPRLRHHILVNLESGETPGLSAR